MLVLTLQEQIEVLVEAKKIYKYGKINYTDVGIIRPLGICHAIVAAIWRLHNIKISHDIISNIIPIFNNATARVLNNANEGNSYIYWWPTFITDTNGSWQRNPERFKPSYYAMQLRNAKPRLEFLDWCITNLEEQIRTENNLQKRLDKMYEARVKNNTIISK